MRVASILLLVLSLLLIAVAYAAAFLPGGAPGWAPWCFAAGISVSLGAIMALGAQRQGRLGILLLPIALTVVIVAGGFALALGLPAHAEAMWLGLPRRAAIVLYGVGLLPLFVLPLAYALSFDRFTLRAEDLERVRAMAAERRRGSREDSERGSQR